MAPLSGVNASIMRMKPSSGQSVESRSTSTWMSSTVDPGRRVRAFNELSLNDGPEDPSRGVKQRRINVEWIEQRATIDEVHHPSRCGS